MTLSFVTTQTDAEGIELSEICEIDKGILCRF